ncbi:3814_t:CDS:2, partial [Racocetra fulgida]
MAYRKENQRKNNRQNVWNNSEVTDVTSELETVIKETKERVKKPKFFIEENVKEKEKANTLMQGDLNDCWFIAALTAIINPNLLENRHKKKDDVNKDNVDSENPNLLENHHEKKDDVVKEDNVDSKIPYLLSNLCVERDEKDGRWVPSIVDDQIFVNGKSENGKWNKSSNQNEVWLPLIEKAFAKLHGDYESIGGGFTGQ